MIAEGETVGPLAFTGDSITIGKILGRGAEAFVYACTNVNTGEKLAVRVISLKYSGPAEAVQKKIDKIAEQVLIAKDIKNKHCQGLRDIFRNHSVLMLVMEIAQGSLLQKLIGTKRFNEEETKYMFLQFLDGLAALHAKGIMHRDLKLENVLVISHKRTSGGTMYDIKICDYGWAKNVGGGALAKTLAGTSSYCAPEVLADSGRPYGFGADFWSLGVMLYALLWGVLPFKRNEQGKIVSYELLFPDSGVSEAAKDLVRQLLQIRPECRAGMYACRTQPWVTGKLSNEEDSQWTCSACAERNDKTRTACKTCTLFKNCEGLQPEAASSSSAARFSNSVSFTNSDPFEFGQNSFASSVTMPSIFQNPEKGSMVEIYSKTKRAWFPGKVTAIEIECTTDSGKAFKTVQLPSSEVRFTTNRGPNEATQGDPVAIFNAIDANGDGVISLDDFKIAWEKTFLPQEASILKLAAQIKELKEQLEEAKKSQQTIGKKELSLESESSQRKRKHEAVSPPVHTEHRPAASVNSSAEEDADMRLAIERSLEDAEEHAALRFALTQSSMNADENLCSGLSHHMANLCAHAE